MATTQQNGILMREEEFELEDGGCGCFRGFWPIGKRRDTIHDNDQLNLLHERREHKESWFATQLKKLKESSELLAGPKWKNFIRKIGAYVNNKKTRKDFEYGSYNYTLNFDDGMHDNEEDGGFLSFSSRFAPPVHDKARSST